MFVLQRVVEEREEAVVVMEGGPSAGQSVIDLIVGVAMVVLAKSRR